MPPATRGRQHNFRRPNGQKLCRGLGIMLVIGLLSGPANLTTQAAAQESLWVSTTPLDASRQLLLVVDPLQRVLAVYHVDTATGIVTLRSTRTLAYDLQLEDFNAADPKPGALKKMMQVAGETPTNQATIIPAPPPSGPATP